MMLPHDKDQTIVQLVYCDRCGRKLNYGEWTRNQAFRQSKPTDIRDREHRAEMLVQRPRALVAMCVGCWNAPAVWEQKDREHRDVNRAVRSYGAQAKKGIDFSDFQRHGKVQKTLEPAVRLELSTI